METLFTKVLYDIPIFRKLDGKIASEMGCGEKWSPNRYRILARLSPVGFMNLQPELERNQPQHCFFIPFSVFCLMKIGGAAATSYRNVQTNLP